MTETPTTPTLPEPVTCEATLYIDADGTWTICDDRDSEGDRLGDGGLGTVCRRIPITITVRPPPHSEDELVVAVPDAAGTLEPATAEVA